MEKGYHRSESEATLYVRKEEANILMLCVYVDDIIYTSNNEDWLDEFRSEMMKEFEMSDLGKLHYFLGLEVHQLDDGIFINQQKYAKQMLKKLKMQDCNAISTPFNPKEKLIIDENELKVDEKYFRSIVGGLMYLSHTRPDLCYAINQVARVMHKPNEIHLLAAKRILKYVAGTIDYGLMFEKVNSSKLLAYSDSDWGSSTHDRKSLTGYALKIGNSCVSWGTKKQDTVALSTAEAEYMALSYTACQVIWMRRILNDLQQQQREETVIKCDNKSAIALANNPLNQGRTKHIDTRYHFIRELVSSNQIKIEYCNTNDQVADGFTKGLNEPKFIKFRQLIGVQGRLN